MSVLLLLGYKRWDLNILELSSYNNVALVLGDQGDLKQAKEYLSVLLILGYQRWDLNILMSHLLITT